MALQVQEFFGWFPLDPAATQDVARKRCPFVDAPCIKPNHGACSVRQISANDPVILSGQQFADSRGRKPGYSDAGMNWENVNKRILPQLIYKGHVLRREAKCTKGLYFVCPKQVYDRIRERLGGALHDYPKSAGTITFRSYEVGPRGPGGQQRPLRLSGQFTTTVDQVALAFTAPMNLPEQSVYEAAINAALER